MRTHEMMSIRAFGRLISKITTDESFERPYGCWGSSNHNGFLGDVFSETTATPIVLADARDSYSFAKDNGDKESEVYYKEIVDNGFHYVSLDGKHRTKSISDFIQSAQDSQFTGQVVDDDGYCVKRRNIYFKDLDKSFQISFFNRTVPVLVFKNVKKQDLSKIFLSLNANSSLSDQHKRNALQTPFSYQTRSLAKRHKDLFEKIYTPNNLASMKQHELISKIYLHLNKGTSDVGKGALNRLYKRGVGLKFEDQYCSKTWKKTELLFDVLNSICCVSDAPSKGLLLYILIIEKLIENDLVINNEEKFASQLAKADEHHQKISLEQLGKDSELEKEINRSSYYFEQVRLNWNQHVRSIRQETIWNDVVRDLERFGLSKIEAEQAA